MTTWRGIWQDVAMKPRRPAVKDGTQKLRGEGRRRKAQQVAARAARKAAAKKAKLEIEQARPASPRTPDAQLKFDVSAYFAEIDRLSSGTFMETGRDQPMINPKRNQSDE
jgi:hypothetical protein